MASTAEQTIPKPALILGAGGLVPFVLATLVILLSIESWQPTAWWTLQSYGAIILSFVGAVHWGVVLEHTQRAEQWRSMGVSVLPALVGWIALWLPGTAAVFLLLLGFSSQYGVDTHAQRLGRLPAWYLRLRLLLTGGVCLCLSAALITLL